MKKTKQNPKKTWQPGETHTKRHRPGVFFRFFSSVARYNLLAEQATPIRSWDKTAVASVASIGEAQRRGVWGHVFFFFNLWVLLYLAFRLECYTGFPFQEDCLYTSVSIEPQFVLLFLRQRVLELGLIEDAHPFPPHLKG